jgi:dynein heavy chain 1
MVEDESNCTSPLLLCSQPGHDASGKVDALASLLGKRYKSVAMGSAEGYDLADKSINSSIKTGGWVLLRNIHLCPGWVGQLEKRLHSQVPHQDFRLFLTSEIHPKLPTNVLRLSDIIVFEPPSGVKASMLRSFASMDKERMAKAPAERGRLYLLLAWFHAIVQERLRYAPVGWTKSYEFSDADQKCALDAIDAWVDKAAGGKAHISPDKIPWDAIRTLMGKVFYGGRVDNHFDQVLLKTLLDDLFSPASFDADFALATSWQVGQSTATVEVALPDGNSREQFVAWVNTLPASNSPKWLGLPSTAETMLLRNQAARLTTQLLQMQDQEDDDGGDVAFGGSGGGDTKGGEQDAEGLAGRPGWMRALHEQASSWLGILPGQLTSLRREASLVAKPLFRWLERETKLAVALLGNVRVALAQTLAVCEGTEKATNDLRALMSDLSKGVIPVAWRQYTVPHGLSLGVWVDDFAMRCAQLQRLGTCELAGLGRAGVWLGGLFSPEAFMTATRQTVAEENQWSLQELKMVVKIGGAGAADELSPATFVITGLCLEGAVWVGESQALGLSNEIRQALPPTHFTWTHAPVDQVAAAGSAAEKGMLPLPVYLNAGRSDLLFNVELKAPDEVPLSVWDRRSTAVVAWEQSAQAVSVAAATTSSE